MKKFILATAVMLAGFAVGHAELWQTPRGEPQALATAQYGGVFWSTAAFGPISGTGVNFTTACAGTTTNPCTGVVYGVIFSSGNAGAGGTSGDFVDIYDSTSSDRAVLEGPIVRIHNQFSVFGSTGSGFMSTGYPLRFTKGLIFKPGQSTNNLITVPFYRTQHNTSNK